jgi:hypothetical protein
MAFDRIVTDSAMWRHQEVQRRPPGVAQPDRDAVLT